MLPVVAIVGRPNVGKSQIFNRIVGSRQSIVDDFYGLTRDRIYAKASWQGLTFRLIDTGGIEIENTSFQKEIQAQVDIAIEEANVIIFVLDIRAGISNDDLLVSRKLKASKKPVVVALNKADNEDLEQNLYDFYSLGFDDMIPTSGIHSIGIGDVLDKVTSYFKDLNLGDEEDDDHIKISVIGRPNVGKSSITNALIGENRVIVSDIEGTTTDSIDTSFEYNSKNYTIIDTAGMRKRGKIFESVEKYSVLRAFSAIERSNICLLVIDASRGLLENDLHIAGFAKDAGKGIIIVVNKWDLVEKDNYTMNNWMELFKKEFNFIPYAPIIFVSAKTHQRINNIFPLIDEVYENINKRINTSKLNDCIVDAMLLNEPKEYQGVKLKVYYSSQVAVNPPTFVLFVNDTECMHFSYGRYLENKIRESFDFKGTPIKIILRKRS
ncbi:MAG: ribosome biogenesis GTPase Der [Gammaproteobacteria bacterium]|nr:ribosome biogenesis GTPase Der [Gammaproteobacteria bacterium]